MLIWDKSYGGTGHVAIVTEVTPTHVRVAEQNFDNRVWPAGANYSRQLRATLSDDGAYTVNDTYLVLGWMLQRDTNPNLQTARPDA